MADLDELLANTGFTVAAKRADRTVTFLPEPSRRPRRYTVISVDDHIVEPPHTFEGRVPRRFADRAPRIVEADAGRETWIYDGNEIPNVGLKAAAGRAVSEAAL